MNAELKEGGGFLHSAFCILRSAFNRVVLPVMTGAFVVLVWYAAVRLSGTKIFPSPLDVARAVGQLADRSLLWRYIGDSLGRVAFGYTLALLLGVPLGILLGWYPIAGSAVNPVIQILRPISPLAWMPLAVIWFGVSNVAPIFLIFLASFFPIVVAATNGVRTVPPMFLQAGKNFGLSAPQLMIRVVIPAVLPRIAIGLRVAFGVAWVVLVAAEMIAVDSGLGYLIIDARNAGKRYDLVVAGMLIIGILGLFLDALFRRGEQWASERR
jgi:NitT/TauT family transport system permease protein